MRRYSQVSPRFWTGTTGKAIRTAGRDTQVVALYLLTAPGSNMVGLYYLPLPTLAHETGIGIEGACKALRCLSEAHFAYFDEAEEVVWIPEMAKHQIGETLAITDKRHKGLLHELAQYGKCQFIKDFWDRYKDCYSLPNPCPFEGPYQGASEPHRSQEQEQEQDQEQDLNTPLTPQSGGSDGPKPKRQRASRERKARAQSPPLPFRADEALGYVAEAAGDRVAFGDPREWHKSVFAQAAGKIRKHPEPERWRTLGAWLAAGGDAYKGTLGPGWLTSAAFDNAMVLALAWEKNGRPSLTEKQKSNGRVVPDPSERYRDAPQAPRLS